MLLRLLIASKIILLKPLLATSNRTSLIVLRLTQFVLLDISRALLLGSD